MKKYSVLIIPFMIFACGESSENQTENEVVEATDSVQVEELIEENNELTFEFIEDYAEFKTKSEIYEQFGEENLTDEEAWYAEGTVKLECTYLNNPKNEHKIKFVFKEEKPEELDFIEARYGVYNDDYELVSTQKIKTKCGTYTGMTLKELTEWNEADFEFSGFGWDFGGGIFPEKGSKIAECPVGMTLDYDYNDPDEDLFNSLMGDQNFKSDNENALKAPIRIGFLTYYIAN